MILSRHNSMACFLATAGLLFAFLLVAAVQTPSPGFTYTLHARKPSRGHWFQSSSPPSPLLSRAPDGSLLVLIPQGGRKWVLKQLARWNTTNPTEETLLLTEHANRDPHEEVTADITLDPSGDYVLIRITSYLHREGAKPAFATLALVDLRTFSLVRTRSSEEPLVVDGDWRLAKSGILISRRYIDRIVSPPDSKVLTERYQVGALSYADLRLLASCRYTKVITPGDREPTQQVREEDGCADFRKTAGIGTVDDLWQQSPLVGIKPLNLRNANCGPTEISDDRRFVLYHCDDTGVNLWDTVITRSVSVLVTSSANDDAVLNIPVDKKASYNTRLASIGTQQYLVLLLDGIRLAVYPIP